MRFERLKRRSVETRLSNLLPEKWPRKKILKEERKFTAVYNYLG